LQIRIYELFMPKSIISVNDRVGTVSVPDVLMPL